MFVLTKKALILGSLFVFSVAPAVAQKEPTTAELRGSLESVLRGLDSCHIVAATRGSQDSLQETKIVKPRVTFLDLWLSGDQGQLRVTPSVGVKGNWWEDAAFKPLAGPLTETDIDTVPGLKSCWRPAGDIRWAESRLVDTKSTPAYTSLYSRSAGLKPTQVFYLPLVHLNRSWDVGRQGAWLAVNYLIETSEEAWKIVGSENLGGRKTIIVEVPHGDITRVALERHEGGLDIATPWKVWFSADPAEGYFPIRIERSMRYGYGNKQYPYERTQTSAKTAVLFEANDIKKYGDTIYYPASGKEETFTPRPTSAIGFDPDKIVDQLLSKGKYVDEEEYVLTTSREWRILALEKISPATSLWVDAPTNSCVLDVDTNARFIVGLSEEESRKRLGLTVSGRQLDEPGALDADQGSRLRWIFLAVNVIVALGLVIRYALTRRKPEEGRDSR